MSAWEPLSVVSASVTRVSPVSLLACDPFKELLWVGQQDGAISCMHSPDLEMRVRVQAHARSSQLLQMSPFPTGVLSTSSSGVRFHTRGGVLKTEFETKGFLDSISAAAVLGDNAYSRDLLLAGVEGMAMQQHSAIEQLSNSLCMMDIATNQLMLQTPTDFECTSLASGRVVACGTSGGSLSLHDPRSFQQVRTLPGHTGGSRKVIVKGDRLLSIGYAVSPSDSNGYGRVDNMVKVYDLRSFRPLPPLLFTLGGGPADAIFLPNFSSTILLVGLTGFWQTMDCEAGVPEAEAYQVGVESTQANIATLCMSSTSDLLFFGDSMGGVHAWSDKSATIQSSIKDIRMNLYSAPVEYVNPAVEPNPVSMDEHTPLVALPLSVEVESHAASTGGEPLLSTLSAQALRATNFLSPPFPPLDEKLLHMNYHIKFNDDVGYINFGSQMHGMGVSGGSMGSSRAGAMDARGAGGRGGMLSITESGHHSSEYDSHSYKSSVGGTGGAAGGGGGGGGFIPNHLPTLLKFAGKGRSIDKLRKKKSLPRGSGGAGGGDAYGFFGMGGGGAGMGGGAGAAARDLLLISKEYARVTIKIPRFGLYAFDFSSYNKTNYTGLDNLLPNSYCNPIIQLLYFIPSIRASMRNHLCERENCLTCELGFLFHMLDHGKGNMVEPRNFLRALRQLPEAGGLGLLDVHENNTTIQSPTHASAQPGNSMGGGGGTRNKSSSDDDELFLASKIQDFWRFLLEQLHKEERESAHFQSNQQEKQNQMQQMHYVFGINQQRRHRNLNMNQNQLQQTFQQMQQSIQQAQANTQGMMSNASESVASLRAQLNHFLNQNNLLYDECEHLERELFQLQLGQMEREAAQANQTNIERVFGAGVDQRIRCQGLTGQGLGSNPTIHTRAHETTQERVALHFTLAAYPGHETDLAFDQLVAASMRDDSSGASQRLFCNTCKNFTIQTSSKSIRCSTHGGGSSSSSSSSSAAASSIHPPQSFFPRALNLMANVTSDMQWEWWKRRDERFGRSTTAASGRGGRGLGGATGLAAGRKAKPSNLYDRFMAAGAAGQQQQQQQAQSSPTNELGYELKPGVVNAQAASSSSSSSTSLAPLPSSSPPLPDDSTLDSLDVHFLPHFLLMFISHERDQNQGQQHMHGLDPSLTDNKTTRTFRVQHSAAKRIQFALDAIKQAQKAHFASLALITQTLLATQLNASNLQQQLLVLSQQSFLVQSKLNLCVQQQQQLMNNIHHLTQQNGGGGGGLPPNLARQLQGMQGSLQQVQGQANQLQGQKMAIAQKVTAIQNATAASTGGGGGGAGGMAQLQGKIQLLQSQLKQLQQSYAARLEESETDLRNLIVSHLSQAHLGGHGGGHMNVFDPSVFASSSVDDFALYELSAVVAHIADPPEKDSPLHSINGEHLVAHIKVERDVYDRLGNGPDGEPSSTRLVKQVTPTSSPTNAQGYASYNNNPHSPSSLTSPHSPTTSSLAVTAEQHDGSWYVFNDFVIRPSNGFEATRFSYLWKQPCAVVYKLMNPPPLPENSANQQSMPSMGGAAGGQGGAMNNNSGIMKIQGPQPGSALVTLSPKSAPRELNPFMHEHMIYSYSPSLSLRYHDSLRSFQPLVSHGPHMETMDSSTLVAIDCEFVSVQNELLEVDSVSEENVVVRPARLTLARVSVVRGSGPMAGIPFIDDYIATSEPVVDYLTKFSGVAPGDLDRSV